MAWSAHDKKVLRRSFPTLARARAWRAEAQVDLRRRAANAPTVRLLCDEAEEWLEDARGGVVRTRSGEPYKPAALRAYEAALKNFVLPEFGHLRLSSLDRKKVQALVDRLVREGRSPSTVANAIAPLRVIYRRAVERETVAVSPTRNLRIPKDRRRPEPLVAPQAIEERLAALPEPHRALWSTAVLSGLRRGELQALRWDDVDLEAGVIRVGRSWDRVAGEITPKSLAGERSVPVPTRLGAILRAHGERQDRDERGLVFGVEEGRPFDPANGRRLARRIWEQAGLEPLTMHGCRHAYASLMIAAGVNAKALSEFLGHSSITVTIDRYGHLLPGSQRTAADQLDRFLDTELDGVAR
jgi:integrase